MLNYRLRKSYYLLLYIIPTVVLLLSPSISFADADRIFKENNKAVVVVVTYDEKDNPISQGSGFIVRADGAIVTNYHVISNAKNIKVKAGNKTLDVEGLIHTDKENDLIILKAKGENLPTVRLGGIEKANIGEKVYVISSPQGLENTISDGILSGIREIEGTNKKILQITASVSSGSSGGPVFNKDGEVIGVATFLIEEAQNLNFAMPVNLIKDKISSKKVTALKDSEIEDYKKTAEYWFKLGFYYDYNGNQKKAIESYKQAIKIKADYVLVYNNLGNLYSAIGMYKEAIESFKQAIRIKPDFALALSNLGQLYFELQMYKEAIEALKKALSIKPDNSVYQQLGTFYHLLGMYKEAIEAYKQAIRLDPFWIQPYNDLGYTYKSLGMYEDAKEVYKQAIRIKPDNASAHFGLGVAYLSLGDKGSALEQYKILKDLDPERANELFNLIYK